MHTISSSIAIMTPTLTAASPRKNTRTILFHHWKVLKYTAGYFQLDHSQMEDGSLYRINEERFGGKEMPEFVLKVGQIEGMLPQFQ